MQSHDAETLAESYLDWWHQAGVHTLTSQERYGWLDTDAMTPVSPGANSTVAGGIAKAKEAPTSLQRSDTIIATKDWPSTLENLASDLKNNKPLPGSQYSRGTALPFGKSGADVMVIGDMPSEEEVTDGKLGVGGEGRLLLAMLAAIGCPPDQIFVTTLASSRHPTGSLPEAELPNLGLWARHQIALVQPRHLLVLGSSVTTALFGADTMHDGILKPIVNHDGGNVTSTEVFHPRILMKRPILKANAWSQIQNIMR